MNKPQFFNMGKLMNCPTEILRTVNPEILRDYIICTRDNIALISWAEDLEDNPDAYSYNADELEDFLFSVAYP